MNAPRTGMTVADLFSQRVHAQPDATAIEHADGERLTYAALEARVGKLAGALRALGLQRGDRVAMWSENCVEYIELELAAARAGLVVACLNWRLSGEEQQHCIQLVAPSLVVVSPRYEEAWRRLHIDVACVKVLDAGYAAWRDAAEPMDIDDTVTPEDGLVILYTSGTTGLPKGALVSQRAMAARAMVFSSEYGISGGDNFIAWSPLFHMAATDHSLATLMLGGKVDVCDGLQLEKIAHWVATENIGWLLAMPGMIEGMIEAFESRGIKARSVKLVGAMADLVPHQQIARLSGLVQAPFFNTFGSTETGLPPASGSLLAAGQLPKSMSKRQSSWCLTRLVDPGGNEVGTDVPGEMTVRGPTLFSGYWGNDKANAESFRDGWFHMGDVFVRHADGSMDFVDRVKYLIKSGGENIYPAEIERVLLAHPMVRDAAVVRRSDARWGEVPVAYIACKGGDWDEKAIAQFCRERLAGYKMPKEFRRIAYEEFPRSSTGKIQRHELEKRA